MAEPLLSRVETLMAAGRIKDAIAIVETAAAHDDVDALMRLATWRLIGDPLPRDLIAARTLIRRAVAIGHVDGALMEAALTANGTGGAPDWQAALALLKAAAKADYVAAEQLMLLEAMTLDGAGNPRTLPVGEQLSASPRVVRFPGFATPAECRHLATVGAAIMEPATVFDPVTGKRIPHPVRTSDGASIGPSREDLVVQAINRRIAAISGTAVDQGEPLMILRYAPGQQYRLHSDAIAGVDNQRTITVLLYLNQGFAGGETQFPELGLKIVPRGGEALLFENLLADGRPEPRARHAGLPVGAGTKWLATRWIRQQRFDVWGAAD